MTREAPETRDNKSPLLRAFPMGSASLDTCKAWQGMCNTRGPPGPELAGKAGPNCPLETSSTFFARGRVTGL